MKLRLFRVLTIILSFFFLTGFVPILSFVGPGLTAFTSGNIYKASAQFIINQKIEKNKSLNEDLRKLLKKRIKITRQKLENQNLQKLVKSRIIVTRSKLNLNNITQ